MINLIKNLLAKYWKKKIQAGDFHRENKVWIYFPNVKKSYHMVISSITLTGFTARFLSDDDDSESGSLSEYGQYDNDIKFDQKTVLPLYMGSKGK